ncbi:winged helix-turn-helix transcriptional regulator [Archangium violaceum]|uniref:MarR family winged helix-turn-helix transcriptional regulator n=1 Tax=Archangium violaceum TaxID=83451 RepID=UPI00195299C4|nr:MarR family winged helix-turn-helix transcriptional regulator [Archangium violaceum]QRN95858.1 winged helix-turn-helix transcriptional regulator [Archangium violaceum]
MTGVKQERGVDAIREQLLASVGEQLGTLLSAARALTAASAARFHPDLQPAAFHVVRWLSAFGPAHAGAIAEGVAMDKSAVSRLIRDLKAVGILQAAPDPNDRRATILSLTPLGEKQMKKVFEQKGQVFLQRTQHWSNEELATFAELLRRFNTPPP